MIYFGYNVGFILVIV